MKITKTLLGIIAGITLAACGGGGGGSGSSSADITLSGIAATGHPIVNGSIQIICAGGSTLNTTTNSTGAWQVTISGQTLPCAVEINGGTINGVPNSIPYHSIAIRFGNVNITPLTDLMLANLVGTTTPNVWFAGLVPTSLTPMTSSAVTTALSNQCVALGGLSLLCATNPVTTVFTPTNDNIMDYMLLALNVAMINSGTTYASLLSDASAATYNAPAANFDTALTDAYIATTAAISASAISTTQSLTVGTAMTAFSPIIPIGGTQPYTFSYTGTLPVSLSFSTSTGVVTGTPSETYAAADVVFSVTDATAVVADTTSTVSFTVDAAPIAISAIADTTAQSLTVGTPMTAFSPLASSGGATPYTHSYTGTLPAGLSFDTSTGVVAGTPTAIYATADVIFSVEDANNVVASTTSTVSFSVGNWTTTGDMTTARGGHTATLLDNGQVLITGGNRSALVHASAELYDLATGQFSASGSMGTARSGHAAIKLSSGKVLIVGGMGSSLSAVASAELYDPITGLFTGTGSMATARISFTATLLPDGKVLIAGGSLGLTSLASAELYDPDTELFTATGSMVAARGSTLFTRNYHHNATLLANGKVLITGGVGAGVNAEFYDSDTGLFTSTGDSLVGRSGASSTLLPDGKVLITGGQGNLLTNLGQFLTSAEVYSPVTGQFTAVADRAYSSVGFTAVRLPNGKVLVVGGATLLSAIASAEVFDPSTGDWTSTSSMGTVRLGHTATLLTSGKVLVTGGSFSFTYAELYQ